jgi:hypothetical protein
VSGQHSRPSRLPAAFAVVVGALLLLYAAAMPLIILPEGQQRSALEWFFKCLLPSAVMWVAGIVALGAGLARLLDPERHLRQGAPGMPPEVEAVARERFSLTAGPQPGGETERPVGIQEPGG